MSDTLSVDQLISSGNLVVELASDKLFPQRFRNYGELFFVGKGSSGIVYSLVPGERFVVKAINCVSDSQLANAEYERRVMDRLSACPRVIQLIDSEIVTIGHRSVVYFIEEYGTPLTDVIKKQRLGTIDCLNIAIGITEALIECRNAGVHHLDVQPRNVFLSEFGGVRIGDFGCALLSEDLDNHDRLRGTYPFMAPEVFRERAYGEQSDAYSVGVILYYLVSGRLEPFGKERLESSGGQHLSLEELNLPIFDPRTRECVLSVIVKACATKPQERVASFDELKTLLAEARREVLRYIDRYASPMRSSYDAGADTAEPSVAILLPDSLDDEPLPTSAVIPQEEYLYDGEPLPTSAVIPQDERVCEDVSLDPTITDWAEETLEADTLTTQEMVYPARIDGLGQPDGVEPTPVVDNGEEMGFEA